MYLCACVRVCVYACVRRGVGGWVGGEWVWSGVGLAGSGWWGASAHSSASCGEWVWSGVGVVGGVSSLEREAVERIDVVRGAHHVVARRAAREAHPAEQAVGHDHGAQVLELWRVRRLRQLPHLVRVRVKVRA